MKHRKAILYGSGRHPLDRDAFIVRHINVIAAVKKYGSLTLAGKEFGISRQAVHDVIKRLARRRAMDAAIKKRSRRIEQRIRRILAKWSLARPLSVLAREVGVSPLTLHNWAKRLGIQRRASRCEICGRSFVPKLSPSLLCDKCRKYAVPWNILKSALRRCPRLRRRDAFEVARKAISKRRRSLPKATEGAKGGS